MQIREINVMTGEETSRDMTPEEIAALPGPEAAPVPASISFAQLLTGLVAEGWIAESEGDAWLGGVLPAPVAGLIGTLPQDQRFAAKAKASRPSEVLRADPLVMMLAAYQGKSADDLDAFFRTYAQV